jgi:hypothetical protein
MNVDVNKLVIDLSSIIAVLSINGKVLINSRFFGTVRNMISAVGKSFLSVKSIGLLWMMLPMPINLQTTILLTEEKSSFFSFLKWRKKRDMALRMNTAGVPKNLSIDILVLSFKEFFFLDDYISRTQNRIVIECANVLMLFFSVQYL